MIDPIGWLARLRAFSQPSEVNEPIELLRAGILFHARGLVNVKAIQHNLDWIWPFWVEKQFKPGDASFVPRAFSFSHINLTHRNWTSPGLPGVPVYPIVDPRGLITPLHDGWSIDLWLIPKEGSRLFPSKSSDHKCRQTLDLGEATQIVTEIQGSAGTIRSSVSMELEGGLPTVKIDVEADCATDGWLAVAVRPYHPDGIQFIDRIRVNSSGDGLIVNEKTEISLGEKPDGVRMARYEEGDVYHNLAGSENKEDLSCAAGMATAAALFHVRAHEGRRLGMKVSLNEEVQHRGLPSFPAEAASWKKTLTSVSRFHTPDRKSKFLFDAAVRTLVMLSAGDLVPGPNTYRRFWFRDACLMMQPMIACGLTDRVTRILESFPSKQTSGGFFLSQEGEWDSNGQVLWIAARYAAVSGTRLSPQLERAMEKGVRWLRGKRGKGDARKGTQGLLPPGFSAEHLGPNDFYYWDDFWALGGLRAITAYWRKYGFDDLARKADELAAAFSESIRNSIESIPERRSKGGIPAAPGRRMDSGAIGSMVADYPLHLYDAGDQRIMATANYLHGESFYGGGFFQQMIHSGINAYLTLAVAQTFMRASDPRYPELVRAVSDLASPTGQWPEAIHPNTLGGCMGDGQHGWAAAEWLMLVRNAFVREEGESLVIGSGILPEWIEGGNLFFGPTATPWGSVSVTLSNDILIIEADWRDISPSINVKIPGFAPVDGAAVHERIRLSPLIS